MIRFGSVTIDATTREVHRENELQHLEPQAFDVLWLLANNAERIVSKEELLDTVWGDQFVSESALTTRIKQIRRAVGDDGRTQHIIRNSRGTGYRFVAEIDQPEPVDQAGATPTVERTTLRLKPKWIERRAGERIAYATIGSGPSLVFMPGWISSIDAFADGTDPRAALVARLAEDFAVTVFDRYGTGLSAVEDVDTSLDASVDEVLAVLDMIDDGPTTLFASSAAGPASLLAAAGDPRVSHLVFLCTYANGPALFVNEQTVANVIDLVEKSWGLGSRLLADIVVPGIDSQTRSEFARFQRATATPAVAAGYVTELYRADASEALANIEQPCLVLHYRDDPAIPLGGSRQLAMGIENTELVTLDGHFHTPPPEHVEQISQLTRDFVAGA